jgi:hypothetical protein
MPDENVSRANPAAIMSKDTRPMATKLYGTDLDFLPETKTAKTTKTGGAWGTLKTLIAAFSDARTATARYETLVSRGVPAGRAARMAFDAVYEQR